MKLQPSALIFDLNWYHDQRYGVSSRAWTEILNQDLHAGLSPEQVKSQMYGKNSELLVRVFGNGKFSEDEMNYWSFEKKRDTKKPTSPTSN
jgi:hypothetical protein